jgi:hypothetical protein
LQHAKISRVQFDLFANYTAAYSIRSLTADFKCKGDTPESSIAAGSTVPFINVEMLKHLHDAQI